MNTGAPRARRGAIVLSGLILTGAVFILCLCVGSVPIAFRDTLDVLRGALTGAAREDYIGVILLRRRLPRVLCAGLIGASLSLSGAVMQGLLRNSLADGSTLGVSSGASLGAAVAIVTGFSATVGELSGTTLMAILFAALSLAGVLGLAYALDKSLSTQTIILLGVVYGMLVSALLTLLITFSGEKLRTITFWTLGSLASVTWGSVRLLTGAFIVFSAVLLPHAQALDLFALGESRAAHLGVSVRRTKVVCMAAVCALCGVCVSVGGGIGFVGLVTPHMARLVVGPSHKRLLPACLVGGANFLMLCDLAARTLFSPRELPIGVITSIIGAAVFIALYAKRGRHDAEA